MTPPATRARRPVALSQQVVVATAADLLDEHGERGFTFKLLTERLRTGAGAVYWYVTGRDELVALAADRVLADALAAGAAGAAGRGPEESLRALALAVYDALSAHPWAVAQPAFLSEQPSALRLLDRIGTLVTTGDQPRARRFLLATVVANYVLGVSGQDAVRRPVGEYRSREAALGAEGERWQALDPEQLPFVTAIAPELAGHDDREQFLAGLDLLLAGLRATREREPGQLPSTRRR